MIDMKQLLTDLCTATGPSGYEIAGTAAVAQKALAPFVDRTELDRLGNVTGYLSCGDENAPTLLLDAHLDEIGLMATGMERPEGEVGQSYVRFRAIGGIDSRIMLAHEVVFHTADGDVHGIVACLPPHVQTPESMGTVPPLADMFVDTGGIDIPVGTIGTFKHDAFPLGEKLFCAKSLDDRSCFALILRALELLPAIELLRGKKRTVNISVLGSTQEEVGGRGALTGAYAAHPQYAIAIDVTFGRQPDVDADSGFKLGEGPCIAVGAECNKRLTKLMQDTAKECGIKYQTEVLPGRSGTNGTEIQTTREGVATVIYSLPLKYMHTPVEVVNLDDIENAARLLAEWMVRLT